MVINPQSPHFYFIVLLVLLFYHFLADFPLQGDFLVKTKDPGINSPYVWIPSMIAHCTIHAGFVLIVTHSLWLALFQFVTHFIIDVSKCKGLFGNGSSAFTIDQVLHINVMVLITIVYVNTVS